MNTAHQHRQHYFAPGVIDAERSLQESRRSLKRWVRRVVLVMALGLIVWVLL